MAEIPNFPEKLLHLHHAWHPHDAHPDLPGRTIPPFSPGGGLEFLTFHGNFVRRFLAWNERDHFVDPAELTPWTAIPAELKDPVKARWTDVLVAQEQRIEANSPPYPSVDALGRDIELGIHNQWLHTAAADVYGDELVRSPITSPRSTFFYKIHGLIDRWWGQFLRNQPVQSEKSFKDVLDALEPERPMVQSKKRYKDSKDAIENSFPSQTSHMDLPGLDAMDGVEGALGGLDLLGPGLVSPVAELAQRLQILEGEVARGQAFIQPAKRPDVSGSGGGDVAPPLAILERRVEANPDPCERRRLGGISTAPAAVPSGRPRRHATRSLAAGLVLSPRDERLGARGRRGDDRIRAVGCDDHPFTLGLRARTAAHRSGGSRLCCL